MTTAERSTTVAAAPDEVWAVLADFGALAEWVPMIQHSCLLSERTEGVGTIRRVQLGRRALVERVTRWRPGVELAYAIEGLPPMVGPARSTWTIGATPGSSGGSTDVTLTTVLEPGRNPIRILLARRVLGRMSVATDALLAGLARQVSATIATRTP